VRCALCALACAFAMLGGPPAVSSVAEAQPTTQPGATKASGGKVSKPRAESKVARERRARRAAARAKRATTKAVPPAPATVDASAPSASPPAAEVARTAEIHTEGETQVKVMEFRGLDIEGQLKTPQMLYFLNRMRAEFGRPRLPHRSFMPELEHSAQERVF
jgi:hypothetical protein